VIKVIIATNIATTFIGGSGDACADGKTANACTMTDDRVNSMQMYKDQLYVLLGSESGPSQVFTVSGGALSKVGDIDNYDLYMYKGQPKLSDDLMVGIHNF